jgi:hypothetical protein
MEPFKSDDGSCSCEVHYTSTITHVYHALLACYCPAKPISPQKFVFVTKGPLELSSRMVLEPEVSQV